jgi:transaldolase
MPELRELDKYGNAVLTLTKDVEEAQNQLAQLADCGIDLTAITQKLQDDGVTAFIEPFAALMKSIAEKRDRLKAVSLQ